MEPEQKNPISEIDPTQSTNLAVGEQPPKNVVGYEPGMYVQSSKVMPQTMLSNNIISTKTFMNEIDLRCDDHLYKYKEDVQATRYCSDCKCLCCDSCVIEFHNAHIAAAKTKIEDYFRKQKLELEDLRSKINSSIKFKVNLSEINNIIDNHEKVLESFFSRRKVFLEEIKSKIDNVLAEEEEVHKKMKETIQIFYREEGFKRLDTPLKENEKLLMRIQQFLKDWNNYSKTDKVSALKNDQVNLFEQENEQNSAMIKQSTEAFKGKSRTIEKKIDEILKGLSFSEKVSDFHTIIASLNNALVESKKQIDKLKYDDVIEEKVEIISRPRVEQKIPVQSGNFGGAVQPIENSSNPWAQKEDFSLMNNMGNEYQNDFTFNKDNSSQLVKNIPTKAQLPPQMPPQPVVGQDNSNQVQNPIKKLFDYDLFISLKPKTDEVLIYNPMKGYTSIKINQSNFQNSSDAFITFPEHSKYVNLGSSLLLTGGYINKQLINNCYLIVVGKLQDQYEVNVMNYGKMREGRERHNIIYLPDRNSVLVCSGFFNKGSEITDINSGEWKSTGTLNETRGNATIAYVNNRFVYVIGGYKINERQHGGMYHGNCEFLDLNNIMSGWTMINFANNTLKLSAMGVIPLGDQYFLLCGGFDGSTYRKEVYKVDASDIRNPKIDQMNLTLPGNYIFLHNGFVKIGDTAYNLELNNSAVSFGLNNWGFNVLPYSA